MIENFYFEKNYNVLDNDKFGVIENLINSFLKLSSIAIKYNPEINKILIFFFQNIKKIFSDISQNINNNKIYTYIKTVENTLNSYDPENEEINPQILNFLKTNINILITTINYCFKNKIMRNESFYLLRTIIRKFDLENIDYFNPIINLLKSFKNDLIENFEILSLVNNLISKNSENRVILSWVDNFLELDFFLKKIFFCEKIVLSENCDYEEEIVKLNYNILMFFENVFFSFFEIDKNLDLFFYFLENSGIYNLKKQILKF